MAFKERTFVIVGAGLAGAKAAETLREDGFEGRLILIGDEAERPYERPPLSKEYLRGEAEAKPYVHDQDFYPQKGIELLTSTRVTGIDPGSRELILEGDRRQRYDRALIATGAEPRRLSVPGSDLAGVHYLRMLADSEAIAGRIEAGGRLVVLGSGWIGAEVAASARQKGCEVTVLERASLPLERVLGPELGRIYRDIHRDHGVEFLPETTVQRFEGSGRVERVITGDDARLEADFVVVGIGVLPRTEMFAAGGGAIDDGILTDEGLATSLPDVFAAGDVANARQPRYGRHHRVEHWANALNQGPVAARAMLGREVAYDEIPYFFSDQYETGMEYAGYAMEWHEVVFRGDVASREFIAFWVKDRRVLAGMNVNLWDVNETIRDMIRSGAQVDLRRLRDPDAPLEELVSERAGGR
jgi:3-phenylpropionate/trans-cinnamate dioxygenase ferredoxin reductase component